MSILRYTQAMRYLGVDYGAKRIGLAVSTEGIAFPHSTIPNDGSVFVVLGEIIAKEKVVSIIVGDTRSFGGHENPVTKDAEDFIKRLKKETGLPVVAAWEAGSSIEASRYAPENQSHDDSAAAAIILQRFLDTKGRIQ